MYNNHVLDISTDLQVNAVNPAMDLIPHLKKKTLHDQILKYVFAAVLFR